MHIVTSYIPAVLSLLILPMATASAALPTEKPVTIMALGDSITKGSEGFFVYRYPLMEKLREAGYNVAYVGSKTTSPVAGSPLEYFPTRATAVKTSPSSRPTSELYRANTTDVTCSTPDTISLPINTDSGHAGRHPRHHCHRPFDQSTVTILLGQVIPSGKLPKYSYIPEYNQALISLAAELNTPKQPVILVNHASGFNWKDDTISDMVHPNSKGAEKMAENWFEALIKILPPPVDVKTTAQPSRPVPATTPALSQSLRLWPGAAPGSVSNPGPEVAEAGGRVSNVSVPMLDVYLPPPDKANGTAIVIYSGGGYTRLASGPLGQRANEIFGAQGYAVFSLKYRVSPPQATC